MSCNFRFARRPIAHKPAASDVALWARRSSVFGFERFIDGLDLLSQGERNRVKIAGSEILDNIIRHSSPAFRRRLRIRVKRRKTSILLAFFFRDPGFAAFKQGSAELEPLFDQAGRRWRGLGLVMCRNLTTKLSFRPGEKMDRIFLEFGREVSPRRAATQDS